MQNGAVEPHYVEPTAAGLWTDVEKFVWHQEEPFHSLSIFAGWNVMRLAAEANIKVLLNGQGADEYLAGYRPFGVYLRELLGTGRVLEMLREAADWADKLDECDGFDWLRFLPRSYCASMIQLGGVDGWVIRGRQEPRRAVADQRNRLVSLAPGASFSRSGSLDEEWRRQAIEQHHSHSSLPNIRCRCCCDMKTVTRWRSRSRPGFRSLITGWSSSYFDVQAHCGFTRAGRNGFIARHSIAVASRDLLAQR